MIRYRIMDRGFDDPAPAGSKQIQGRPAVAMANDEPYTFPDVRASGALRALASSARERSRQLRHGVLADDRGGSSHGHQQALALIQQSSS